MIQVVIITYRLKAQTFSLPYCHEELFLMQEE